MPWLNWFRNKSDASVPPQNEDALIKAAQKDSLRVELEKNITNLSKKMEEPGLGLEEKARLEERVAKAQAELGNLAGKGFDQAEQIDYKI